MKELVQSGKDTDAFSLYPQTTMGSYSLLSSTLQSHLASRPHGTAHFLSEYALLRNEPYIPLTFANPLSL